MVLNLFKNTNNITESELLKNLMKSKLSLDLYNIQENKNENTFTFDIRKDNTIGTSKQRQNVTIYSDFIKILKYCFKMKWVESDGYKVARITIPKSFIKSLDEFIIEKSN